MKLTIAVGLDSTHEVITWDSVPISTNPEQIRAAMDRASVLVQEAVDVLIERALAPLERNELREVIR